MYCSRSECKANIRGVCVGLVECVDIDNCSFFQTREDWVKSMGESKKRLSELLNIKYDEMGSYPSIREKIQAMNKRKCLFSEFEGEE